MWYRSDVQRTPAGWMKVATQRHSFPFLLRYVHLKVRRRPADQKLMALPKEAARFASLKASDTVWG